MSVTFPYGRQPALKPWLDRALEEVELTEIKTPDGHKVLVEVTNGRQGDDREAARICLCDDAAHAELVAAAIWALVI